MYEVRFFTTKNCSPMEIYKTKNKIEAINLFDDFSKKYMWAYIVEILENGDEKVIKSYERPLPPFEKTIDK